MENMNFWVSVWFFCEKTPKWPNCPIWTHRLSTISIITFFFTYYCLFVLELVYYQLYINYVSIKSCFMHLIRNKIRISLFTKIDYSVSFFLVKISRTQFITCFLVNWKRLPWFVFSYYPGLTFIRIIIHFIAGVHVISAKVSFDRTVW